MTASIAEAYGILGLTSDATLADVKKAYRKLARQHPPDRNNADPGAIDRFRRITEAYEYLSAHRRVEVTGCPVTSPSGPGMHVSAHTAQASHEGSQVLCSRVRSAMAAGLRRLQSA